MRIHFDCATVDGFRGLNPKKGQLSVKIIPTHPGGLIKVELTCIYYPRQLTCLNGESSGPVDAERVCVLVVTLRIKGCDSVLVVILEIENTHTLKGCPGC